MPRTEIATQSLPGFYSQVGLELSWAAADVANGNSCARSNQLLLFCRNTGATPRLVTVSSVADQKTGRTGDASATIPAGAVHVFQLQIAGWRQDDELFYFDGAHAEVEFAPCVLTT